MYSGARIEATFQSRNPVHLAAIGLGRKVAEVLATHYPQHPWWVHVYPDGTAIVIGHYNLSADKGYMLHSARLDDNPTDFRMKVVRAGGEILERYDISRTAQGDQLKAALAGLAHSPAPERRVPANG